MNNVKELYIIGASGLGREMECWLELIPKEQRYWTVKGYIDLNENALDNYPSDYKILGDQKTFTFPKNSMVIIAIAKPEFREKIFTLMKKMGVEIMTHISPNTIIGKSCKIGEGSIICPNSIITTNVEIGKCVFINSSAGIGHDVKIDDFTSIMANVNISGNCKIGKRVFMGSKSTVIPGKTIKDNVIVGAGSVVINNIKKPCTVFGNPALKI